MPGFLQERVTQEQAEQEIKNALEFREERFLELMRAQVFDRSNSPYQRLFRFAGCGFSDLTTSVRHLGRRANVRETCQRRSLLHFSGV